MDKPPKNMDNPPPAHIVSHPRHCRMLFKAFANILVINR